MSDNTVENNIPQIHLVLKGSKKEEFDYDEWQSLWTEHEDNQYRERFKRGREQNHTIDDEGELISNPIWHPEEQETEMVYYLVPGRTK